MPLPNDRGLYVNTYRDPRERVWRADVRLNADDVGGGFTVRGTAEHDEHPADALLRAVLVAESMMDNPIVSSAMPANTRARLTGVRILGYAAREGHADRFACAPQLSPAMRYLAEQLHAQATGRATALAGGPLCVHAHDDGAIMGAHPWAPYKHGRDRGRRKHRHAGARGKHPAIMGWGLPSWDDVKKIGQKFERMVGRAAKKVEKIPGLKWVAQQDPELQKLYAVLDTATKLSKAGVHPKVVAAVAAQHQVDEQKKQANPFRFDWGTLAQVAASLVPQPKDATAAKTAGINVREHRHAPGAAPTWSVPPPPPAPAYGAPPAPPAPPSPYGYPAPPAPQGAPYGGATYDATADAGAPDGSGTYADWQWQQWQQAAAPYGGWPGGGGDGNGGGGGW